jgi:hypothetical protein
LKEVVVGERPQPPGAFSAIEEVDERVAVAEPRAEARHVSRCGLGDGDQLVHRVEPLGERTEEVREDPARARVTGCDRFAVGRLVGV